MGGDGGIVVLVAGVGTLLGGLGALWRARSDSRRQRTEGRQAETQGERDIAAIVNERAEIVFRGYQAIFDEREDDIRRLLDRVEELKLAKDGLADRVRELAQELATEKRRRREDRAKIVRLEAEIVDLRRGVNGGT